MDQIGTKCYNSGVFKDQVTFLNPRNSGHVTSILNIEHDTLTAMSSRDNRMTSVALPAPAIWAMAKYTQLLNN